jgi:hypothetical protein
MYMFVVGWMFLSPTLTIVTRLRKNGVDEAQTYSGALTHVVYLTTTDYVEAQVYHSESASINLITDWQVTHVTCTQPLA